MNGVIHIFHGSGGDASTLIRDADRHARQAVSNSDDNGWQRRGLTPWLFRGDEEGGLKFVICEKSRTGMKQNTHDDDQPPPPWSS